MRLSPVEPLFAFSLLLVAPVHLHAQRCPPCDVALEHVVTLGSLDDPVGRSMYSAVARLSNGDYVLAPMFGAPQIALYDPDGAFKAMFDRRGSGPRELNSHVVRLDVGMGDTIYAMTNGRLLRLNAVLVPLSPEPLPFMPRHSLVLQDGRIAVSYPIRGASGIVNAVHLLEDGKVVASFDTVSGSAAGPSAYRVFGRGSGASFWVARVNRPRLDLYSDDGRHVRAIHPEMDWFEPWETRSDRQPFFERPFPYQTAVRQLEPGRLLVLTRVADEKWTPQREEPITPTSSSHSLFDTVISLVDSRSGRLLATRRFEQSFQPLAGADDLLFSGEETQAGDVVIQVWRIRLVGR